MLVSVKNKIDLGNFNIFQRKSMTFNQMLKTNVKNNEENKPLLPSYIDKVASRSAKSQVNINSDHVKKMYEALEVIGRTFDRKNILWAVGNSLMLNNHGIVEHPNDVDLFISEKDWVEANKILKKLAPKDEYVSSAIFASRHFSEYTIKDVDFDMISGFRIKHKNGFFEMPFDKKSIAEVKQFNGVKIPFSFLEDALVAYQLMGREAKGELIKEHLEKMKWPLNKEILFRAISGNVPGEVKRRTLELIKKLH